MPMRFYNFITLKHSLTTARVIASSHLSLSLSLSFKMSSYIWTLYFVLFSYNLKVFNRIGTQQILREAKSDLLNGHYTAKVCIEYRISRFLTRKTPVVEYFDIRIYSVLVYK